MQIAENVHVVPRVVAHVYLIIEGEEITMIDTGIPRSSRRIRRYLNSIGLGVDSIRRIIVTHADVDHFGALSEMRAMTNAQIMASPIERRAIEQGKSSRQIQSASGFRTLAVRILETFIRPKPCPVDAEINPGDVLPILGGLEVLGTPGHTPAHISLYSRNTGFLFAGDALFTSPGRVEDLRADITDDMTNARESIASLIQLKPKFVCPGHGPVVNLSD